MNCMTFGKELKEDEKPKESTQNEAEKNHKTKNVHM